MVLSIIYIMNKIFIILISILIIFVGTGTYALLNENQTLHDVSTDIQQNNITPKNDISQNNTNHIQTRENTNITVNDIIQKISHNTIKEKISDTNSTSHSEPKLLKIIRAGNTTFYYYDDGHKMIIDNRTNTTLIDQSRETLSEVHSSDVKGGYIICAECGDFIPVGQISKPIPTEFLCNCTDQNPINTVDDVSFVYSEESVETYLMSVQDPNNNIHVDATNDKKTGYALNEIYEIVDYLNRNHWITDISEATESITEDSTLNDINNNIVTQETNQDHSQANPGLTDFGYLI